MSEETLIKKNSEVSPPKQHPKRLYIPRREPSVVVPPRTVVYVTADKTTCEECICFPKEEAYRKNKKLNPCQHSPLTLYELAAKVVDILRFPEALKWSGEQVAEWIAKEVGLPEYRKCFLDNHINGMRLLMFEDPSRLPEINIHDFIHIKIITSKVRQLFNTDYIRFVRSISLPPRKPLTHCTWFKSRTGPSWGVRENWTRCDVLRWMKIIFPEPIYMNHWDLVWYQKPDFPRVLFARIPGKATEETIPHYVPPPKEICKEYMVLRKFRLQTGIPEDAQMIWMEKRPEILREGKREKKKKMALNAQKESRLTQTKIKLEGLKGRNFLLAKRKMPKPKFLD